MAPSAMKTPVFRLLDLPPELRNRVYEYTFEPDAGLSIEIFAACSRAPQPALTAASHQIRNESLQYLHEATQRFWRERRFFVAISPCIFTNSTEYKSKMEPLYKALKVPPLRQIEFRLGAQPHKASSARSMNFEVTGTPNVSYRSRFWMEGCQVEQQHLHSFNYFTDRFRYLQWFGDSNVVAGREALDVRKCIKVYFAAVGGAGDWMTSHLLEVLEA